MLNVSIGLHKDASFAKKSKQELKERMISFAAAYVQHLLISNSHFLFSISTFKII